MASRSGRGWAVLEEDGSLRRHIYSRLFHYDLGFGLGNGGVAADWFSEIARECAPGPQGRLNRPPSRFRPEWADEEGPSTGNESVGWTPT